MGCFVLFNDYKQQAETIERLNGVMNKVRGDLLERADIGNDGTRAVNLSHSVWLEFCDAIDKTN
ncbi:hypothetical protein [Methylophaga sp. UBA5088]|jgi:hypothetical protein|uniref:hypothetical protein n=1 Tax=Methylophaga sp. UBA5088 TaxID=1946898 RepID=UPI00259CFFC7|nr:hypothetical protein [Methylophaga sp. UBA5088]|tara:strand:+ start:41455 stop:41646 length:192 start_codon:yes stop_codon:yes gene_type:complete